MDATLPVVRPVPGKHLDPVFLEVGGELTVPNVESLGKLLEMLGSGKYNLDLSGAELRVSGAAKRQLFDALRLGENGSAAVTNQILLRALAWRVPSRADGMVHKFMRKGSRDRHSAVVQALAKERRAVLEMSATPPTPLPLRRRSSELLREEMKKEPAQHGGSKSQATPVIVKEAEEMALTTIAGRCADKLLPQPYEELNTYRSATTASELGTSRHADESGGSDGT